MTIHPHAISLFLQRGRHLPKPSQLGQAGGAGEGPHSVCLTLGGGGASHSCFCFQRRMCRVPLLAGGGAGRAAWESDFSPLPKSPSGEGAVEVSSRESPLPRHLGSGFPKREALTTHRLGDGICKGSWGLGPDGLGEGERERETEMRTWARERCRRA